jgi:hypothetical protein
MSTRNEVWKGEGGAHALPAPKIAPFTEAHRTLGIGVLYAITIVGILAVAANLH